jgi:histidinol-phosphate aminotransferase
LSDTFISEEHGGIDPLELRRLGISTDTLIDFSVNSNPFGPSPAVIESLKTVDISVYPDRQCSQLRSQLSELSGVEIDRILVGNGTSELFWLICHANLHEGDTVLILGPTFGEYRRAAETCGAILQEIRAEPPEFTPPVNKMIEFIQKTTPRLVFVCNPNNPTGKFIPDNLIADMLESCSSETTIVLDEAYRSFIDGQFFHFVENKNCLVVRSMTKDFALAGLRLGYVMGPQEIIKRLTDFQPAWSVNAYAQAAGIAALQSLPYYWETFGKLSQLKSDFFSKMSKAGFPIVSSSTHYGIFHVNTSARVFRQTLLLKSIQVRDCSSFGLMNHIRVSTKLEEENNKLVGTLSDLHLSFPTLNF